MKEPFCLLFCFVWKGGTFFLMLELREKDFEPADVKMFFLCLKGQVTRFLA